MYGFVNKKNVASSKVSFKDCPCYINKSYKPQLVSSMVEEFTKTGQLPNSSPLQALNTFTEDIDSLSPEVPGGDNIDNYIRAQEVMDFAEIAENKYNKAKKDYDKAVKELKDAEFREKLKNVSSPPAPAE